jgi:hypothetical protein
MQRTTLCDHLSSLRREWGLAPLCGAAATFTGCSEDPSRPWVRRCFSERHRGGDFVPSLTLGPICYAKGHRQGGLKRWLELTPVCIFAHGKCEGTTFSENTKINTHFYPPTVNRS